MQNEEETGSKTNSTMIAVKRNTEEERKREKQNEKAREPL